MAAASDDISSVEYIDLCQETAEVISQPSSNGYQASLPSEVQVTGIVGSVKTYQMAIIHDRLPLMESMLKKIEKNYCVNISKDVSSVRSNGQSAQVEQVISISGSKGDCKNAGVRLFLFYGAMM